MARTLWLTQLLLLVTGRRQTVSKLANELKIDFQELIKLAAALKTTSSAVLRNAVVKKREAEALEAQSRAQKEQQRRDAEARRAAEHTAAAQRALEAEIKAHEARRQRRIAVFLSTLTQEDRQLWNTAFSQMGEHKRKEIEDFVLSQLAIVDDFPQPPNDRPAGARLSSGR